MQPAAPLRLKKGVEVAVKAGMPWVYAGEFIDTSELALLPAGSLVSIETQRGEAVGVGYFNARSQIACRVLGLGKPVIDAGFFTQRLRQALEMREKRIGVPFYRLIHSEGDHLPGLLLDRFGGHLVAQCGTAGMEGLMPLWLEACEQLLKPQSITLRNDTAARKLEGLLQEVRVIKGEVPELVEVEEYGCIFYADLLRGQKTGWFYDQRDNRKMIADRAAGKTLVDVFSHSGGFGLPAAKAGAQVTLVDSSKLALELGQKAAARNGVGVSVRQGDAFEVMEALKAEGARFDIVLADPPAFVKQKKDMAAGLKGYAKVARLAAGLCKPGGLLFVASCSHHAGRGAFNNAVLEGVRKAGLSPRVVAQTGAAPDHPQHPKLKQNEYLKGILLDLGGC